jgi:glyoxylase-like metal-dependent hydrolase (beta-lactamase superfamily II)
MNNTSGNIVQSLKLDWTWCFLLKCTDGYLLIDTAYTKSYHKFRKKLAELGIAIHSIKYLLITHHHDDHAGFASNLVKDTGCRVIVHSNAAAHLRQGRAEDLGKVLNRRVLVAMKLFELFIHGKDWSYPPLILTDRDILIEGDNDNFLKAIGIDGVILDTPGHTDARDCISVLLSDGSAFVGDAAMNFLRWAGTRHRPIYIGDIKTVYESWQKLLKRGAKVIYPSHGNPFSATELKKSLGQSTLQL